MQKQLTYNTACSTCSQLKNDEYAYQKYGSESGDTFLPAAAQNLAIITDFAPSSSRKLQLRRCPECGTYYLYRSDYEYLVNGSEDEEFLTRLTDEAAAEYINHKTSS